MAEGVEERVQTADGGERRSREEVERLAAMGRGEISEKPQDSTVEKPEGDADERPEWLPEKFKSPADLAQAYAELEKRLGKGEAEKPEDEEKPLDSPKIGDLKSDEDDEGDEGGEDEGGDEAPSFSPEAVTKAITEARDAWTDSGELSEDHRKALNAVGFDDATIDTYLEGVKAVEDAMRTRVFEMAGGEQEYRSAVQWAAKNWSAEDIAEYDKALENPKLLSKVVMGLMAEYRAAVPSEGRLTSARGEGQDRGAVYADIAEFHRDLNEAGEDRLKRQAAITKLQRSRKAGTVKGGQRLRPLMGGSIG